MSIKKNTFWNLFGSASPMLIGLVAVPFIFDKIGVEKLGILTMIWAIIGYFSIFDFGLGRALTQKISSLIATQQHSRSASVAKSGMTIVILTGLTGGAILFTSILALGVGWLKVSDDIAREVTISLLLASIAVPITTATSGLKGILEGMNEFKVVNLYRFTLGLANFITPVLSIKMFGNNLSAIVLFLVVSRFFIMLAYAWSIKIRDQSLFKGSASATTKDARELISFGSWMTLSNLLSPLMVISDRFLISAMLGASLVAYYTIPSEFLLRLLVIPAALTTTLFPVFAAKLLVNPKEAQTIYNRSLKVIFLCMLVIACTITISAHTAISFWLNKDFADKSYLIVAILSVGILFNSMAQMPLAAIQANGDAKTTSLVHLFEFFFYVPVLYLSVKIYGIGGAAFAWSIRAALDFIILQYIFTKMIKK
jgi:O-antigen/teichoic acid export membrane protein